MPLQCYQTTRTQHVGRVAIFGDYVLSLVSSYLNYQALGKKMPVEFQGTYDEEAYAKSQEYTRVRTKFSWAHSTVDLSILLVWWFGIEGFELLDGVVRGAFPGACSPPRRPLRCPYVCELRGRLASIPYHWLADRMSLDKACPNAFLAGVSMH